MCDFNAFTWYPRKWGRISYDEISHLFPSFLRNVFFFFFFSVKWSDSFNFCVCHHGGFREHKQPFLTGWPNIYHTATWKQKKCKMMLISNQKYSTFDGAGVFSAPSLGSTNVNVTRSSSKAKRVTRGSIFHSITGLFLCGVFNIRWAHFTHDRTLLNTSVQV